MIWQGHLMGEHTNTGALIQETVWLNDLPIATIRPNGTGISVYFIHADELGTPRVVTDTTNKAVWRWDGDAFGRGLPNQDPLKTGIKFVYHLRYPGQYYDTESGLHYNYFRDYDPETGRYIQSDPIGLAGGFNTYAYVGGNPLTYIDPFGLCKYLCTAIGPTGKAPDTGRNYDSSDRKWCTYSCRKDDAKEQRSVNGPGHNQSCIGQSGGDEYDRLKFNTFTHDTDSWFDRLPLEPLTHGPDFDQAIRNAFEEQKK
jgi:RHS repeat-associated protein